MVYVITGAPGSGKTTLINLLAQGGFRVGDETGRDLIEKGPTFPLDFEQQVGNRRIAFLASVSEKEIAFADRGLPDQLAYTLYKHKLPSDWILQMIHQYRYAKNVFVTTPWKKIFVQDKIRMESWEEAMRLHELILEAYQSNGYFAIEIPHLSPEERVEFILDKVGI